MGGKRPEKISEGLRLQQASRSTYIAFLGVRNQSLPPGTFQLGADAHSASPG